MIQSSSATLDITDTMANLLQRGRKRKSIYDRANEDQDLVDVGDGAEEDAGSEAGDDFEAGLGEMDDLDAIMGDAFLDDQEAPAQDREDAMPSRAEQSRPEDSTMDFDLGTLTPAIAV